MYICDTMSTAKVNSSRPSYKYAIVSITIVLFFLGAYLLILLHNNRVDSAIKERLSVVIELKDGNIQAKGEEVMNLLQSIETVNSTSITYHPQDEGIAMLGLSEDALGMEESPFRDMITFSMLPNQYKQSNLEAVQESLLKLPQISDVIYETDSDVGISALLSRMAWVLLVLTAIFIILALIIVHNTLSLILYADRWEINTMDLVGARRAFIRRPYIAHGRIIGQKAFVWAAVLLVVVLLLLCWRYEFIYALISPWYLVLTLLFLLLISTLVSMVSTFTVVNRFLDQKLSDLHS